MLVTFRTRAYADITMFGDVALRLLKMMGHSGTIPGAIMPEDIPSALERLQDTLARLQPQEGPPGDGDDEQEPPISLKQRALPLIQLLQAAQKDGAEVMWDR